MVSRTYKTDAIVLRSLRYSEADRILHLYTRERGRIGAIAKGVRKTRSRFGARLEPLSHVQLVLHEGSGELHTVTGAELVRSHHATREDPYRLNVGLIGAEAMLRLFAEPEPNPRAFAALTRFLDLLDEAPAGERGRTALDALALSFQLKLLWVSGYLPHVTTCVECGSATDLIGFSARAGGAVCRAHARGALALSSEGSCRRRTAAGEPARGRCRGRPERPRSARRARRDHLVVRGARRLPPADALRVRCELGDGFELDDDPERIDVAAVHRFLAESYWAEGREYEVQERLVREAQRVVGLYLDGHQVGFCRAVSDGVAVTYLADVYVLPEYRGRGLGVELVREMVERGPYADLRWTLHTHDAHELYRRFGFDAPGPWLMERPPS